MKRFKKGAASFYVVAFSTLILLIVVASFTALVVAQITRSSNDDLSQSAYDSALAGVEDAKLAYYNYQSCLAQGVEARAWDNDGTITCGEIIWLVENEDTSCDVVAKILGRTIIEGRGVSVDELSTTNNKENNMQQAYTCVKLQTSLKDYRASLSTAKPIRVVNVKLDNMGRTDINADAVDKMRVSWGSDMNGNDMILSNYDTPSGSVTYPKITGSTRAANPPTIGVALVQANGDFRLTDFDLAKNGQTNRGHIYLTPVGTDQDKTVGKEKNYYGTDFSNGVSVIGAGAFVSSNDASTDNLPYGVNCPNAGMGEFACAVDIALPKPIGGTRSDDNFMIALTLPYGGVSTDIMLEFFCKDGSVCGTEKVTCDEGDPDCEGTKSTNQVNLKGVQIGIDSTGRANDLFRRVDTRLEGSGDFSISVMGPLELFGEKNPTDNSGLSLGKDYATVCEYNFSPTTCN